MQEKFALNNPKHQIKIVNTSPCDLNISNGIDTIDLPKSILRNNKAVSLSPQSLQFNITSNCTENISAQPLHINVHSNETTFIYLESNQLKYAFLKHNTSAATIGNSELKFFLINTNHTLGSLKSTVERGKLKKQFAVQTKYNDSLESYAQIAHEEYEFQILNANDTVILSDKIILEITGRYTIVLFPYRFNSNKYLDYVVLTDILPNGWYNFILKYAFLKFFINLTNKLFCFFLK